MIVASATPPVFMVYLLACWFFGLSGIVDVLLQPRRAFKATGRSKLRWLAYEVVGMPLTGIFTWGYYAMRVRPQLLSAGGRPPRQFLKALASSSQAGGSATPKARSTDFSMTCMQCSGHGSVVCTSCGGSGKLGAGSGPRTAFSAAQQHTRNCGACGGRGRRECEGCRGAGRK
jgi:hypothetical protein